LWRFTPLAGPEPGGFGDCRSADFSPRRQSFEKINGISGSSQTSAAEALVKARGFCRCRIAATLNEGEVLPRRFHQKPDHPAARMTGVLTKLFMQPCDRMTDKTERVGTNDFKPTMRSSRLEMPVDAAGHWRGIGGELLDEIDHLGALRG
jgi:hypothetical protein